MILQVTIESDGETQSLPILAELERHIHQQNRTISRLKTEMEDKNRKIASLRAEAVNYQMRYPATAAYDGKGWNDDDRSGGTAELSELSTDLQQQLQDAQMLLCQKEEELAAERKRFSIREAALLACVRDAAPEVRADPGYQRFFL